MNDDAMRAFALLDEICQDSLETPLSQVRAWGDDGEISVLFRNLADAIDRLVVTYPAAPVDRMISDLRDLFFVRPIGVMTRRDFEERVLAFKDEMAGREQ